MADCVWCDKTLPGSAIPACKDCIFRSREEASGLVTSPEDLEEKEANIDLSGLGDEKPKVHKGRTSWEVKQSLATDTLFREHTFLSKEIPMKTVRIKSNSLRSRQFVVDGSLVLAFDEHGFANILESELPLIVAYSRVRPGRFTVVVEAPEEVAPVPVPEPAPKKEATEPEVEKVEEPKPKSVIKAGSSKKKKSSKKDSE